MTARSACSSVCIYSDSHFRTAFLFYFGFVSECATARVFCHNKRLVAFDSSNFARPLSWRTAAHTHLVTLVTLVAWVNTVCVNCMASLAGRCYSLFYNSYLLFSPVTHWVAKWYKINCDVFILFYSSAWILFIYLLDLLCVDNMGEVCDCAVIVGT